LNHSLTNLSTSRVVMKKLSGYYFSIFLILIGLFVFSCIKDPYKDQLAQQKNQIADYVAKHNLKGIEKPSGLYFAPNDTGLGDRPGITDYVLIKYKATFLDGTLFDTTDSLEAQQMQEHIPWFKVGGPMIFGMNSNFPGMVEGLSLLREGGNATLIMPSSLAANDLNFIPRIYYVELLKVYHNISSYQKLSFDSLMTTIGYQIGDSITGGVIDTTYLRGNGGGYPSNGDSVRIHVQGFLMDSVSNTVEVGRKFEDDINDYEIGISSAPYSMVLPIMRVGGKATMYFPYYNAFGSKTYLDRITGQILVPPYSNLKYYIEFVGFVKNKKLE